MRRRLEPTVVNIKPRLPHALLHSKSPEERQEYCRVQLLLHRPFFDREDYNDFMTQHNDDFVAAYTDFSTTDGDAPACVRDDFRELHLESDGEHLDDDELPPDHEQPRFSNDYSFYRYLGKEQLLDEMVESLPLFSDWGPRSKQRYTAEQITDAERWMQRAKQQPIDELPSEPVDVQSLNPSQRFIYNVVEEHFRSQADPAPLHALICGTAGSGKTYLIGALKQLLGKRCLVCAPTGVAADNIGGVTYHSKLPTPRDPRLLDINDVRLPQESTRLQQLEADFASVSYLIIDEMSMVGRRSLGQIDDLLQQAKNRKAPFGGISVLLVGDHGQLPPVKDHRAFDWEGVRHRSTRSDRTVGAKIDHAPRYQYDGTRSYELLSENVFFLDKVERVARSDNPAEAKRLQHFQEFQLRARDGELTKEDWQFIAEHMDAAKRPADFQGNHVYRLVTTRKLRDSSNLEALEKQVRGGAPGISIPAVHTGSKAEAIDDDNVGLARTLVLCVGARVMVTKNLSVAHGLCNGTMGTVFDVICNEQGDAVSILLCVKRRTAAQRGYAGPNFLTTLPEGETPLGADKAIIALDRWSESVMEDGEKHTRSQFPVMLASCVTIHKAQGLTLDRVLIDAGPDERAMGQLFVALTRVRHPDHVAFSPVPSLERVTTLIAQKKSLFDRKRHECHLRSRAARTAQRVSQLQPAGFTVGAIPPQPARVHKVPDPSQRQHGRQATLGSWQQEQQARASAKVAAEKQAKKVAVMLSARCRAKRQLEVNRGVLSRFQLPPAHKTSAMPLPRWLEMARPLLELKARVVDYLPSRRAHETAGYLRRLGFDVNLDCAGDQIGNTCGAVAAWVAIDLQAAHLAEAGGAWHRTETASRFNPHLYRDVNHLINLAPENSHDFISGTDVIALAQHYWEEHCGEGVDVLEWLGQPETFDFILRQIVEDLHGVAEGAQEGFELRVRVSNTDDCLSTGTHWFTVAYSVRIQDGASSVALYAMRERLLLDVGALTAEEVREMHAAEMDYYSRGSAGSAEQSTTEPSATCR